MKAFIVKDISDNSFKLKIDYHPKVVELLKQCQVIDQITKNIRKYSMTNLEYVINSLLGLGVSVNIVKQFEGGEKESLVCLWAFMGSAGYGDEDEDEESDRFEVHVEYRPYIIQMMKTFDGCRYSADTQRWSFPTECHSEFCTKIISLGHKFIECNESKKFSTPKKRVFRATLKRNIESGFIEAKINCKTETSAFLKTLDAKFDGLSMHWNIPISNYSKLIDGLSNDLGYSLTSLSDECNFKAKPVAKLVDLS